MQNKIETDTNAIEKERFQSLLKQKPNRKILGLFQFHLSMYNLGNRGKETNFKKWLKSIGEEPAILDSMQTLRSRNQLLLLLNQKGFFHAEVRDSVILRKKKARVIYKIQSNRPYTIRNIRFETRDPNIQPFMEFIRSTSLLKSGEAYDEEKMNAERERIASEMKDRGFYYFGKNYITYEVDSSLQSYQADLNLYVNRINENVDPGVAGNLPVSNHHSFNLQHIYIRTDYNPRDPAGGQAPDTTIVNGIHILSSGKEEIIRNEVLVNNIFINRGDRFLQRDLDYTYTRLQELNTYKFINIQFNEVPRDSIQDEYLLNVHILLTPMDMQDFTTEAEATNTGGNLGIAGSFGWRNKNVFSGAEVLEMKVKGALEALPNLSDSVEEKKILLFNTYEIGPEVSLTFKKFLLPGFITRNTSRYFNPRSILTAGFNFQDRPDYRRSILNASFGYNWQLSRSQRWIAFPVIINAVTVDPSPGFRARLDSLNDPRLSYSYETHLIPSSRYTWIFNNQQKTRNFFFIRGNLELSGLLLRGLAPSLNLNKDEQGSYEVFGIPFSQYVKPDLDVSFHHSLDQNNTLVYRIASGIGFPFANSKALPFEKSFFAGGANSIRAWNARTLGPGSYRRGFNLIEQSGDIKIEANLEYRSFLFRVLEGALLEGAAFVDAGNIWTRHEDLSRPGAQFEFANMFKEFAVGAGIGFRFNFSFFILRLDAAVKLRDPSLDLSERWVYPNQKFVIGDIVPNLAIGYPF
jgi:outer membrane translocation and assembly module TamA